MLARVTAHVAAVLSLIVGCEASDTQISRASDSRPEVPSRAAPEPAAARVSEAPERSSPPVVVAPSPSPAVVVAPPRPGQLRVATYNILGGKLGLDEVIAALQSFDADMIALQEVDSRTRRSGRVDQPKVIAKALGMEVAFADHRPSGGGKIGVVLLSRHPLANVERVALPGATLAAVQGDVAIAGHSMRTLVVHLHPTDPRDPPARRKGMDAARLREADAVLVRATDGRRPTIVMGDFNAFSNGPEYAAFSDHFDDACPNGSATWPASLPIVRIDYVWISRELETVGCPSFTPTASDHRPVVADLRFTTE